MRHKLTFALLLIVLVTASAQSQSPGNVFSRANVLPPFPFDPERFDFSTDSSEYTISKEGTGFVKIGATRRRNFNLRLDRHDRLVRVYHAVYEGDLLLVGEVTDGLYGAGFVARLDWRALTIKWKRSLPAFNVGQALIDESSVYVTGVGFIGKISLRSGKYIWKHEDLYWRNNKAFSFFDLPAIQGNTVAFKEEPSPYRTKVAVIVVDRVTGRIVRIDS